MKEFYNSSKNLKMANLTRKMNLYPFLRAIEGTVGSKVHVSGKQSIMIGSNNYLGLTHHPHVQEAAIKAIEKYGTGCTGSRFLNGNLDIHEELEERLAKYTNQEAALLFSTGMQVNLGAIPTLCGPRDCLIYDSENHASLIDASRLALGATFKYKHNDMESLEEQLQSVCNRFRKKTIVVDGVFSMTGTIAKLPEIVELGKKYDTQVYVDDAHGTGVLGDHGRGTANFFGLDKEVEFIMGTFSKSFASIGGFVAGDKNKIDYVKHNARSFMFSASMPPAAVATVNACLDVIFSDKELYPKLWENVNFMRKGFKELGFYTYNSQTPIIPIFIGDDIKSFQVTNYLYEKGLFCTPVAPPAVPIGEALIRTSYMPSHTMEDLTYVLEVFEQAKKDLDIPTTSDH